MPYSDLREFINALEEKGELVRVKSEVDSDLEITEILNRLIVRDGPAVIFENVKGHDIPVVSNIFNTVKRVAFGLGTDEKGLRQIGEFLASLQNPAPPKGLFEAVKKIPFYKNLMELSPKTVKNAPCQEVVLKEEHVDLSKFPILRCWPKDAGQLITWPLVITRPPDDGPVNVGIYRMQVLSRNTTIIRWLRQRGGAAHYHQWMALKRPMPVAVAIGNEPAMVIAATTPLPEDLSEFHFAGLLRRKATELVQCRSIDLAVPATSEIVLEGEILPDEFAMEGPFNDHTGYYNPAEPFPVFHIKCITHRHKPLYMATVTGRPPREDAILGLALNAIFLPILKKSFPEVEDFSLPMDAVSYRIAVISIKKEYPGHTKRLMMGLWGFLKQFLYIKYIIVVDPDIDVNNWSDVIWALSTRVDPARDVTIIENTPVDALDFASVRPGLGSKMGIDATMKTPPEVDRPWGEKAEMDPEIIASVDRLWQTLGIKQQ